MAGVENTVDTVERLSAAVASLAQLGTEVEQCPIFRFDDRGIKNLKWERTYGTMLNPDQSFTADALLQHWPEIHDFTNRPVSYPDAAADFGNIIHKTQSLPANKNPGTLIDFGGKVVIVTGGASG